MAKLRIRGDTSGYVDIAAPAVAGTTTVNLDKIPQTDQAAAFTSNITTTGSLGIGTTSPSTKVHYSDSSTGGSILKIENTSTGGGAWNLFSTGSANSEGAGKFLIHKDGGLGVTMQIDGSGRINTPKQPVFRATRSNGGITFTGTTTLIYDIARINIGNHYNTSTGIFTAPVAGSYAFSFNYYTDAGTPEMVDLVVNDSTIIGRTEIRFDPGNNTVVSSGMIVYYLNANDNVRVKNTATGVAELIGGTDFNYFNGYLIG